MALIVDISVFDDLQSDPQCLLWIPSTYCVLVGDLFGVNFGFFIIELLATGGGEGDSLFFDVVGSNPGLIKWLSSIQPSSSSLMFSSFKDYLFRIEFIQFRKLQTKNSSLKYSLTCLINEQDQTNSI